MHKGPHFKVGPKVRDIAPRGQTENTTRDLRSYRVEQVRFKVGLRMGHDGACLPVPPSSLSRKSLDLLFLVAERMAASTPAYFRLSNDPLPPPPPSTRDPPPVSAIDTAALL